MTHYILQIIFFQLLFLLVYELFLKKETFFNYNRAYLLLTPVVAVILPLLKLDFLAEAVPTQARIMLPEVIIGNTTQQPISANVSRATSASFSINWYLLTYALGVITSLVILVKKYSNLTYLYRFRRIAIEKDFKIIEVPNSNIACTFFNTVFLGDQLTEAEKNHILSHELVHVKQRHSLDLVFFEAMKVIFWFNPLIYIYQSRIAGLHEFIADEQVVKTTEKRTYYEQLLNTAFSTQNISFINQFFNHSLIKKRIVMLQKNKSSQISKFKFLLIIPAMLLMLTYVACSDDNSPEQFTTADVQGVSDQELKQSLREELKTMQEEGVEYSEIADAFMIEKEKHVKSREAFYRLQVYLELIYQKARERSLKNGTYNKEEYKVWKESLNQTYDEYVAYRKSQPVEIEVVEDNSKYDKATSVPFALIEKVPAFKECDQWVDDARKNCTSNKISDFVNKNFDTSLGKKLGLSGVNRVIVQFRIDETGHIQDIKGRATHPELVEEAKRVISELPAFIPGEQKGRPVSVMYSLPIAFQVQ